MGARHSIPVVPSRWPPPFPPIPSKTKTKTTKRPALLAYLRGTAALPDRRGTKLVATYGGSGVFVLDDAFHGGGVL